MCRSPYLCVETLYNLLFWCRYRPLQPLAQPAPLSVSGSVHFWPRRFAVLKWFEDACVRLRVYTGTVRNELIYICEYATTVHTHTDTHRHTHTHTHTNTHTVKPFEDSKPMGLKVDIAREWRRLRRPPPPPPPPPTHTHPSLLFTMAFSV